MEEVGKKNSNWTPFVCVQYGLVNQETAFKSLLIEYLTRIEYKWLYRFHVLESELCISLLSGLKTWAFCLMIRNTVKPI
jgi:hypothetical protein